MPDRLTDAQWRELRKRMEDLFFSRVHAEPTVKPAALAGYLLMLMDRIDGLEGQLREGKQ